MWASTLTIVQHFCYPLKLFNVLAYSTSLSCWTTLIIIDLRAPSQLHQGAHTVMKLWQGPR